jgi:hypothetical protein
MKFGKVIILVTAMAVTGNVMATNNRPDMSDPAVRSRVTDLAQDLMRQYYDGTDIRTEGGFRVTQMLCQDLTVAVLEGSEKEKLRQLVHDALYSELHEGSELRELERLIYATAEQENGLEEIRRLYKELAKAVHEGAEQVGLKQQIYAAVCSGLYGEAEQGRLREGIYAAICSELRRLKLPINLVFLQRMAIETAVTLVPFCGLGCKEKRLMDALTEIRAEMIQDEQIPITITGGVAKRTKNITDASELMTMMYNQHDAIKLELGDQAARKEWLQREWNTYARAIGYESGDECGEEFWKLETTNVFVGFTPCTLPIVTVSRKSKPLTRFVIRCTGELLQLPVTSWDKWVTNHRERLMLRSSVHRDPTVDIPTKCGIPRRGCMSGTLGVVLQMIAHWQPDLYYLIRECELSREASEPERDLCVAVKNLAEALNSGIEPRQSCMEALTKAMKSYDNDEGRNPLWNANSRVDVGNVYFAITGELWEIYGRLLGIDYGKWRQTISKRRIRISRTPMAGESQAETWGSNHIAMGIAVPNQHYRDILRCELVTKEEKEGNIILWTDLHERLSEQAMAVCQRRLTDQEEVRLGLEMTMAEAQRRAETDAMEEALRTAEADAIRELLKARSARGETPTEKEVNAAIEALRKEEVLYVMDAMRVAKIGSLREIQREARRRTADEVLNEEEIATIANEQIIAEDTDIRETLKRMKGITDEILSEREIAAVREELSRRRDTRERERSKWRIMREINKPRGAAKREPERTETETMMRALENAEIAAVLGARGKAENAAVAKLLGETGVAKMRETLAMAKIAQREKWAESVRRRTEGEIIVEKANALRRWMLRELENILVKYRSIMRDAESDPRWKAVKLQRDKLKRIDQLEDSEEDIVTEVISRLADFENQGIRKRDDGMTTTVEAFQPPSILLMKKRDLEQGGMELMANGTTDYEEYEFQTPTGGKVRYELWGTVIWKPDENGAKFEIIARQSSGKWKKVNGAKVKTISANGAKKRIGGGDHDVQGKRCFLTYVRTK